MTTPLKWQEWERELKKHPDSVWVEFVLRSIRHEFWIGYNQEGALLERGGRNLYSAFEP